MSAATDMPAADSGDDYKSRPGQSEIPVTGDNAAVEDPIDPATADSDETLGMHEYLPRSGPWISKPDNVSIAADESAAMDQSNIISERTRGAKPSGSYTEPGDDEVALHDMKISNTFS